MGELTCVACGECVQACPTGALMPASLINDRTQRARSTPTRSVDSLCPFCGVGCQVTYHVKDERIVSADGKDGPANHNRLCVKGRFGFDYIHHPHRLTKPLVRLEGIAEGRVRPRRSRQSLHAFSRGELGRGARPRRRRPRTASRRAWGESACRLRHRPRAPTKRLICSRSWCARASAPTMSTIARGSATPPPSPP